MTYTVQNGDTLASIAAARSLESSSIAEANRIDVDAELEAGQELELPPSAEAPSDAQAAAERTDAAYARYEAALVHMSGAPAAEAGLLSARDALDAAVAAEIAPHVNAVPQGIPGTPDSGQLIASHRDAILARHEGDPAARAVLDRSIEAYRVEHLADQIAQADVHGNAVTPQDRLDVIVDGLAGEPPSVIAAVLRQPSVQRRIDAVVEAIAEPQSTLSAEQVSIDQQAALMASERLLAATEGAPPELAALVVERSLPTIGKIASVDANYSGAGAYSNVSGAVAALGDGPRAQALTREVAEAWRPQYDTWSGRFADPNGGIVRTTVASGGGTALSIELASQLAADGRTDEAGAVLRSMARGAEDLQHDLERKITEYGEHTKDLAWLIQTAGPNMTADQLAQATRAWVDGQDQAWRDELAAQQQGIVADSRTLLETIGALDSLPTALAEAAPDIHQSLVDIASAEDTQAALQFALELDPTILSSPAAGNAATLLADVGQKGSDLLKALGSAYITGHVMPAIAAHHPLDPQSAARTAAALEDLQTNGARLLGIPQQEVDAGVARLRTLADTLEERPSRMEALTARRNVVSELEGIRDLNFSSGPAAVAFRTLALGMSGAALLTSARTTIDNPNAQNVIGTLAYSVGLAQDATAFAATVGVINAEGRAATWGMGASTAGQFTAKFVGVLNAAYFVAGTVDQVQQGSVPGVLFNAAGAGGALLATFGTSIGLGSWAGPVGIGVMILATGGVALVQHRQDVDRKTEAAEAFYAGGGVDPAAIGALADEAAGPSGQFRESLGLTPEQMQTLAVSHPDIFGAPGHAQAIIDVVQANGIDAADATAFIDALAVDDPDFLQTFFGALSMKTSGDESGYVQGLRDLVQNRYPVAAELVREQSPELFGDDAEQRTQAAADYRTVSGIDAGNLGNLLEKGEDPAYRAEIIRLLEQDGALESFLVQTVDMYSHTGNPDVARSAIESARDAGVLSVDRAEECLDLLG